VAGELARHEGAIVAELAAVQGKPVQIGGYYHPDVRLCAQLMRPSALLNRVIDSL
jgi:isocitrate dehydrogenase